MPDSADTMKSSRQGTPALARSKFVIYAALAGNMAIAASKFVAALMTGSSAMLAEGLHSLVDTGNECLLLVGINRSRQIADQRHPFGYGKASYFWALIVALSVFSLGGGISIYQGIVSLRHPPALADPTWNYVVLAVAAVFEGFSWRVSQRELQRRQRPDENLWQAFRHSNDASVFTVFIEDSAALIGIGIAATGIALSHVLDNPYFDPAASVLIGMVLIGAAVVLARECSGLLLGRSLDREQISQLRKIIAADLAVERVGQLLTMRLGTERVLLTAAIRFRRPLNLDQVEQAIARLEAAITARYPAIHRLYLESGAFKASSSTGL